MRLLRSHPAADTAHPVFGRGNPRKLRVIRQRLGNAGWEDSNCVPGMHSCRTGLRCPNCSVRKTRTGRELNSRPYRVDFGANTPPEGATREQIQRLPPWSERCPEQEAKRIPAVSCLAVVSGTGYR